MSYKSLDGIAIKFPDLSDRALMNIYPCTFMRKLLLRNPEMPCRLLTINSITCVFRAMLAERCLQESQYSDLSEQYGTAVERWEDSADWKLLRQILIDPVCPQSYIPYSLPSEEPFFFEYGSREFSLPLVSENLFTSDGLKVGRFIDALKEVNHHQRDALSVPVVNVALAEFAIKRFPGAIPGLKEKFTHQLELMDGVYALEHHCRWLTSVRENRSVWDNYRPPAKVNGDYYRPPPELPIHQPTASDPTMIELPPDLCKSSAHNPSKSETTSAKPVDQILLSSQPLSERRKRSLILEGRTLLVFAQSRRQGGAISHTTHAHLHDPRGIANGRKPSQRVVVIPAYDPSIAVVCRHHAHRNNFAEHLKAKKFSYGVEKFSPQVVPLRDDSASTNTIWWLDTSANDCFYNLHESLRLFFCNTGYVHLSDVLTKGFGPRKLQIHATSPRWLLKLARSERQSSLMEAHIPKDCTICKSSRLGVSTRNDVIMSTTKARGGFQIPYSQTPRQKPSNISEDLGKVQESSLNEGKILGAMSAANGVPIEDHPQSAPESWRLPNTQCSSLEQVTISGYITAFVKLNGKEVMKTASSADFVLAFNQFINNNFPNSSYEAKMAALRRFDPYTPLGSFQPICQELLERHFFLTDAVAQGPSKGPSQGDHSALSSIPGGLLPLGPAMESGDPPKRKGSPLDQCPAEGLPRKLPKLAVSDAMEDFFSSLDEDTTGMEHGNGVGEGAHRRHEQDLRAERPSMA